MALLDDFLQSPGALAMASTLLQASGPSRTPVSLGQAIGAGMQAMQASKASDLENKYKQTAIQQASLQNQQIQNKLNTAQQIKNLIGVPSAPSPGVPFKDVPGTGLLGGQLSQDQARAQLTGLLAQQDPQVALGLLGLGPKSWSAPIQAMGADGKMHFIQLNNNSGETREISGYTPLPKNNMALTYDPVSQTMSFMQGPGVGGSGAAGNVGEPVMGSNAGPAAKDATKGPSKGGQGGTYTDIKTGRVYSTDTNRQTTQDQATIAAIQRLEPMMQSIITQLPQFQQAATRGKAAIQGVANNFFGANFKLPSDKAEGESQLNAAPDPLLKVLGLPSTDEGIKTVRGIIAPQAGESPQYYQERVTNQLMKFRSDYMQSAKDRLANGITLSDGNVANSVGTANVQQPQAAPEATATKTINGQNFVKLNGQWYQQ